LFIGVGEVKPISVHDLKQGMRVAEEDCGSVVFLTIQEDVKLVQDATRGMNGWSATGMTDDGTPVCLFVDAECSAYGPNLYLLEEQ
jgi:hypothetical protein